MEIWKDVEGYEGMYRVSSYGRVIRLERMVTDAIGTRVLPETMLMCCDGTGSKNKTYYRVALCRNGKKENVSVHRLVARTFIPNPENKPCVNHIDGNKHNNHVENLEWVTYSENTIHAYQTGLIPPHKAEPFVEKKYGRPSFKSLLGESPVARERIIEEPVRLRKRIIKYDSALNPVAIYETKKQAQEENNLRGMHIGVAKPHNGYYYAEEGDPMTGRQWDRVRGKRVVV